MVTKKKKIKLKEGVSEPTLKRLPGYLTYLKRIQKLGHINVSAPTIASELELDPTQIVKDLTVTGIKGKPKVGYNIAELILTIEEYLGFNKKNEAFLVGAGKLGQAILSYHELQGFGINIITAFDIDPKKINTEYGKTVILHMDKLGDLAQRLGVSIGILTTPPNVAQKTAKAMVKSGIKAIWNLTPVKLKLPKGVIVQDTSMFANVAILLKKFHDLHDIKPD
ncbi:MAG: redox-sensing transcriptional repressor Rex [Salinivirgaceae bacterium]|nr:redox-sensing transcriptional repressor Rex [Salinivirgaceae bacterium]